MKIFSIIFLLITVSFTYSQSQSGWFVQTSRTSNQDFNSIFFPNMNTGYAVGRGIFFKTTNSGDNWISYSGWVNIYLSSVFFTNESTGYVTASEYPDTHRILKTTDGGFSWVIKATYSENEWYSCLYFLNPSTGIAAGNKLRRTTDAGNSWIEQTLPIYINIGCVNFIDNYTGFACGGDMNYLVSRIIKTTNGGIIWINLSNAPNFMFPYTAIRFINGLTGFATYGGLIVKTTNGGLNWSFYNQNMSFNIQSIWFTNENTGFICGYNFESYLGNIYKTTNCGSNWNLQYDSIYIDMNSLFFINENTGFGAGMGATIIKTTTGGEPIGIEPVSSNIPVRCNLYQNYPNPFNPSTRIKFDIKPAAGFQGDNNRIMVVLKVFDVLGREISILVNQQLKPGSYEVIFDTRKGFFSLDNSSGIYFYRLQAGDYVITKKMVMLK
jgi:photosystem II stability/assembly factor-like uncharacterized protein